jgi:hypothetical protein
VRWAAVGVAGRMATLPTQRCNNEQVTETMVDFVVTNLSRPAEWGKAVRLKLFSLAYKLRGTRRQVKKA